MILKALYTVSELQCDKFSKYNIKHQYVTSLIHISRNLSDIDTIIACILQDVIRLGIYTYHDIIHHFNEKIANTVLELTYNEDISKLDKKLWLLNNIFSEGAQTILLSNYLYIIQQHINCTILDEYRLIWIWHLVRKMDKANAHIRICIKLHLDMLINSDYDMNDKLQEYLSTVC